jgi:ribosomal protein S18 acetylase RimI-like enzyme
MINIRNAVPADAAEVVRLIHELAEAGGETCPLTEAYAIHYLSSAENQVLLAEAGGSIVGLLSYSMRPDLYHAAECCMIEELIVADDQREQGIGGALLDGVIERAIQRCCAEVSVSTMPENQRAQEFYRQHGLVDEAVLLERHLQV